MPLIDRQKIMETNSYNLRNIIRLLENEKVRESKMK